MQEQIDLLLKRNQLSITDSRKKILELFLQSKGALAHGDIERRTGEKFDRVTVYRTLQVFLEKGIIHTIPSSDNAVRYALCKNDCTEGHHHDDHVHFICEKCGTVTCLSDIHIPALKLPHGFQVHDCQMVVNGICRECDKK